MSWAGPEAGRYLGRQSVVDGQGLPTGVPGRVGMLGAWKTHPRRLSLLEPYLVNRIFCMHYLPTVCLPSSLGSLGSCGDRRCRQGTCVRRGMRVPGCCFGGCGPTHRGARQRWWCWCEPLYALRVCVAARGYRAREQQVAQAAAASACFLPNASTALRLRASVGDTADNGAQRESR